MVLVVEFEVVFVVSFSNMTPIKIVLLPGDGIGPEVMQQAKELLTLINTNLSTSKLEFQEIPCGGKYYIHHEKEWPDEAADACKEADAILLGAVGHIHQGKTVFTVPGKPYETSKLAGYGPVIGNRKQLELYANVRPVKLIKGLKAHIGGTFKLIWAEDHIDYIVVRENTEGAYSEIDKIGAGYMSTEIKISREATARIARFAFKLASGPTRKGSVTCVDKSNIIAAHTSFREIVTEIGKSEYPNINLAYSYFDSFCYHQLQNPASLDIVVAPNLVGDVISDIGAFQQGGLGMAPSGNMGDKHAMFEPVHGSAPTIAGKNMANPFGMFLSVKMMLEWLSIQHGIPEFLHIANLLEKAIFNVISIRKILTRDLIDEDKATGCCEVGEAVKVEFLELVQK